MSKYRSKVEKRIPFSKKYNYGKKFFKKSLDFLNQAKFFFSEGKIEEIFRLLNKDLRKKVISKSDIIHFACLIRYTEYKYCLERLYKIAKKNNLLSVSFYGIYMNYLYNKNEFGINKEIYLSLDENSKKNIGILCSYLNTLRKLKEFKEAIQIVDTFTNQNYMIENNIGLKECFWLLSIKAYCLKDFEVNGERKYLNDAFNLFKYLLTNMEKNHEKFAWVLCGCIFCLDHDSSFIKKLNIQKFKEDLHKEFYYYQEIEEYRANQGILNDIKHALNLIDEFEKLINDF